MDRDPSVGSSAARACQSCGDPIEQSDRYCPRCGSPLGSTRSRVLETVGRVAGDLEDLLWGMLGWSLVLVGLASVGTGIGLAVGGLLVGAVLAALLGLGLVGAGLVANPRFGRQLSRRHEPTTFGRVRTVDHRVVRPVERNREPCTACGERFDVGLVRRRRDELVVAGLPVRAFLIGYTHYCADCADVHVFGTTVESTESTSSVAADADASGHEAGETEPAR